MALVNKSNVVLRFFNKIRAWFVSFGDNWFHSYDNRKIIIIIGKEIEKADMKVLKAAIQDSAIEAGVESQLNKIVKKEIEMGG